MTAMQESAGRAAIDARAPLPAAALTPMERFAFRAVSWANRGGGSALGLFWQRRVLTPAFRLFISRRLDVHGLDRLRDIPEDASILLVANHRSFFDLFVLGLILTTGPGPRRNVSFPVRANFFYENPLGLLICLLLSGGSMFPPFFRAASKRAFNAQSLEILVDKLRAKGGLIGFHPEGTRNKGADPYDLLPAQPGAGELALKARPTVVPAFINGLSNSMIAELLGNFRGAPRVVAIFGAPIELPATSGETRLSQHKRLADAFLERIRALGAEERSLRATGSASRP
jgi:1-acyl-sn-glycerol-3-phosphate acyltransferase